MLSFVSVTKKETTKDRLQRKVAERKKQSHEDEVVTNELEKMNKTSDMTEEQHREISEMMNHSYEESLDYAYEII